MESKYTFEEIIAAWMLTHDDRLPNTKRDRIEAFITLLGNLSDHGYNKEDITISRKKNIIGLCVNPSHPRNKLNKWISMVLKAFNNACLIYYGTPNIRKDILTPEMVRKLDSMEQKEEESKLLRTPEDAESNESETSSKTDIDNEFDNIANSKNFTELTDEMIDSMTGPTIIYDEDFYKKLGIE